MNNKGFTLVELIAVIILLALVAAIGTYSITAIINGSKDKNYKLLINEIKAGAELYYQECKYANNDKISCELTGNNYVTTLGDLVRYGYITGNSQASGTYSIVNTKNNADISNCQITISYSNGTVTVTSLSGGNCPTEY